MTASTLAAFCREKWRTDFEMQDYCREEARDQVNGRNIDDNIAAFALENGRAKFWPRARFARYLV
jgi:hypothetical protein